MKENKFIILAKLEHRKEYYVPFGIILLSNALRSKGYEVKIFHGDIAEFKNNVVPILNKRRPLFIGFTTHTGPQLIPTIKASKFAKSKDIPVVWGGVHATLIPDVCLNEEFVDFVVRGYGEEIIIELVEALNGAKDYKDIDGLCFKNSEGAFISNNIRSVKDISRYSPDWENLNISRYYQQFGDSKKALPLLTSRGCPHSCGFCYNVFVNKRRWISYDIDYIFNQIDLLKEEFNIDGIYFHDDNFFVDFERAKKIIDYANLPWFAEARADLVTPQFVNWLVKSKCSMIFIGAETGSDKIMENICKGLSVQDVYNAVYNIGRNKIEVALSFIVGFPGETESDRKKTIEFIYSLEKINPRIKCWLKLYNPYPSTPLWEKAIEAGFKPPTSNLSWAQITRSSINLPWIDKKLSLISRVQIYKLTVPFYFIGKWRWKYRFFSLPIDVKIIDILSSFFSDTNLGVSIKKAIRNLLKVIK